jgi:hypothetical protein
MQAPALHTSVTGAWSLALHIIGGLDNTNIYLHDSPHISMAWCLRRQLYLCNNFYESISAMKWATNIHSNELHDLYSSHSIVGIVKPGGYE